MDAPLHPSPARSEPRPPRAALSFKAQVALVWVAIFACILAFLAAIRLDTTFMREWWGFIVYGAGTDDAFRVGIVMTLFISVVSITLAVIFAFFGALGRLSKNPIAYGIATFYVSLIRGTPFLIQIFLLFFGLPQINQQLNKLIPGFEQQYPFISSLLLLPAVPTGILALAINYGAYMTETFRAGIQSISKGQSEAAYALGMSPWQTLRLIILPQAFRVVIPPVGNEFIAMTKDSALVSVIGVQELLWRAQKVGQQYFHSMETLLIAAAFYWLMTILLQAGQSRIERRLARSDR
ncbi:MAG: amino acid ABC transporter permease [Candidatus Roseilinea sp.]|nr:MAG: amino acid ABC transporter permease [Candidatus Roseilinea sp.]